MTGPRFHGYCSASIQSVYNEDFEKDDVDLASSHGCYAYRLLHGLSICGQSTTDTFARLLKRCSRKRNSPMCSYESDASMSTDEVGLIPYSAYWPPS